MNILPKFSFLNYSYIILLRCVDNSKESLEVPQKKFKNISKEC